MKINWLSVVLGIMLAPAFPITLYLYLKTGYATPYLFEPVYGNAAKIVVAIYGFVSLFGIYLIISGIKRKKGKDENAK